MDKKSRYTGTRIDSFIFSRQEVLDLLEDHGNLRGRSHNPTMLYNGDGTITIEYTYHLEEKPYGN